MTKSRVLAISALLAPLSLIASLNSCSVSTSEAADEDSALCEQSIGRWHAPGAGNFSGSSGYTQVTVLNTASSPADVTVSFFAEDGSLVASHTQRALPSMNSFQVGTSDAFSNAIATNDFNGYVVVEDSSGDASELFATAVLSFPVDGSSAVGNSVAPSSVQLPFYPKP